MFGPEGRPQHCCAWLGVASSFPECASAIVPEEVINFSFQVCVTSFLFVRENSLSYLDSLNSYNILVDMHIQLSKYTCWPYTCDKIVSFLRAFNDLYSIKDLPAPCYI